MRLIIDIPEETYKSIYSLKWLCTGMRSGKTLFYTLMNAIKDGTPLPKGHKRLIEDNFDIGPVFNAEGNIVGYKYVTHEDLNNARTIIEADKAEGEIAK